MMGQKGVLCACDGTGGGELSRTFVCADGEDASEDYPVVVSDYRCEGASARPMLDGEAQGRTLRRRSVDAYRSCADLGAPETVQMRQYNYRAVMREMD